MLAQNKPQMCDVKVYLPHRDQLPKHPGESRNVTFRIFREPRLNELNATLPSETCRGTWTVEGRGGAVITSGTTTGTLDYANAAPPVTIPPTYPAPLVSGTITLQLPVDINASEPDFAAGLRVKVRLDSTLDTSMFGHATNDNTSIVRPVVPTHETSHYLSHGVLNSKGKTSREQTCKNDSGFAANFYGALHPQTAEFDERHIEEKVTATTDCFTGFLQDPAAIADNNQADCFSREALASGSLSDIVQGFADSNFRVRYNGHLFSGAGNEKNTWMGHSVGGTTTNPVYTALGQPDTWSVNSECVNVLVRHLGRRAADGKQAPKCAITVSQEMKIDTLLGVGTSFETYDTIAGSVEIEALEPYNDGPEWEYTVTTQRGGAMRHFDNVNSGMNCRAIYTEVH